MLAGSSSEPLELERRNSAAAARCSLLNVMRHVPDFPAVRGLGVQDSDPLPAVGVPLMVNDAVELLPLYIAVTVAAPNADDEEVALKVALLLPWRTATVAGTVTAELLLNRLTDTAPPVLESVTLQVLLEPAVRLVDRQVTDDTTGADHNVRVTACEELPSVALTVAVLSALRLPTVTEKEAAVLPTGTVTPAGRLIPGEAELRLTAVEDGAGCDRTTLQEVDAPDITLLGLQVSPLTSVVTARLMPTDWLEPL